MTTQQVLALVAIAAYLHSAHRAMVVDAKDGSARDGDEFAHGLACALFVPCAACIVLVAVGLL